jgi:hypothetical protein
MALLVISAYCRRADRAGFAPASWAARCAQCRPKRVDRKAFDNSKYCRASSARSVSTNFVDLVFGFRIVLSGDAQRRAELEELPAAAL